MTFEQYTGQKNNPRRRESNKAIIERFKKTNKHINFEREEKKTNARKDETQVTCIECKTKFILPFKPRRPEVYCDSCFKKRKNRNY